jgi:hypothetical protein
VISKAGVAAFDRGHAQERPAAIRPLGVTGKMPVRLERMDAIRNTKTMAGSPDADLKISVSQSCAWFLCFEAPSLS